MMKLKDVLITKAEVENDGHQIDNEMIRGADISVTGHFGNAVSLNVFTGSCCLLHDCNNTENLGILIKAFVELFELTEEDMEILKVRNPMNYRNLSSFRRINNAW